MGALWLVLIGALIGVLLALLAVAPRVEEASVDAGVRHSHLATHCAPESDWPCEPSR
jgi:hypothetical protein